MIKDEKIFRQELMKVNTFWTTGAVEEKGRYPIERDEVEDVLGDITLNKISIVTGPRRCGKSVLVKHLIAHLIESKIPPRNILYYSLDDPYLKLYCDNPIKDIFEYWMENIASEGKQYIFFDEIHFVEGWYEWLKVVYDQHRGVKIFISGSSALPLQHEANRYLKGRYILHQVWPLTFRQFLKFERKSVSPRKLTLCEAQKLYRELKSSFRRYMLRGGFPESFEVSDIRQWFMILKNSVSNKAIYEDIAATFKIRNVRILEQIFTFIVEHQSQILSYEKINEIAQLKHEILLNYLKYLKTSYLIIEILKYAKSIKEQFKAKKKFLCVDQGLRNALLKNYEIEEDNEGFIIENIVGIHCYLEALRKDKHIMYSRTNGEIDFVIPGKEITLIEVKYKNALSVQDIQKIKSLMNTMNSKCTYLVTKGEYDMITVKGSRIFLIPALIFCLFIEDFV